jgi:hypothetical protein
MELIKLIWDFRGPNSAPIATHHAKHLTEFIHSEKLENSMSGTESVSDMHHIAFLITEKKMMQPLRERLKPNRGTLYSE